MTYTIKISDKNDNNPIFQSFAKTEEAQKFMNEFFKIYPCKLEMIFETKEEAQEYMYEYMNKY